MAAAPIRPAMVAATKACDRVPIPNRPSVRRIRPPTAALTATHNTAPGSVTPKTTARAPAPVAQAMVKTTSFEGFSALAASS
jgi:hypothetical protein